MRLELALFCILFVSSCKKEINDLDNTWNDFFIHHQIIIENDDLDEGFYLQTSAGHNLFLNPDDTTAHVNGEFGTLLKNWTNQNIPYTIWFYYLGNDFGCVDIEISTFVDFELFDTNNFTIGEFSPGSYCSWNENSLQYNLIIN